jgi:hypothetical protein
MIPPKITNPTNEKKFGETGRRPGLFSYKRRQGIKSRKPFRNDEVLALLIRFSF